MTYDWTDYLEISKELISTCSKKSVGGPRKETVLRTAISRAYYAAFHKCRDYLDSYGDRLKEKGTHRDLIDKIDNHIQSGEVEVAMDLDRAFSSRKKADYKDTFGGIEKESEATIKRVENIISEMSSRKVGPYK